MARSATTIGVVRLSVHGPVGVVDLVVPADASPRDLAREYARAAGGAPVTGLCDRLGRHLEPARSLAEAGVRSGAVLVATTGDAPAAPALGPAVDDVRPGLAPGPLSALWCCVAVAGALLAALVGTGLAESSTLRTTVVVVLGAVGVLGALPLGPLAAHRVLAAPAFVGSAALVLAWDPAPDRLPTVLGVSALAAAVAAAVARALGPDSEEGLRVWMIAGVVVFAVTSAAALVGLGSATVWSVLLAAAMLAARFVPLAAVDVPDHYLLDLERLAVTAWSARERPTGRRGRIIVPQRAMAVVAASGTRLLVAAGVAILAVSAVAGRLLLDEAGARLDSLGARCLVGFAGVALLLAARSYRHAAPRALLRVAGLLLLAQVGAVLLPLLGQRALVVLAVVCVVAAALLVLTGVALGRGWRSAWWSRRAEVAEGVAGALALACLVLSTGAFREMWELASSRFGS